MHEITHVNINNNYYSINGFNLIVWVIGCVKGHHLGQDTGPREGGDVIVNWAWLIGAEMCCMFWSSHIRVGVVACAP